MSRRRFLARLACAPLALGSGGRLFAAPAAPANFLLVFLRGGCDAANVVVPTGSSFYYESRPNIAIARPGSAAGTALALDADWSLHPALRDSLYPLYPAGQVAFVPFAGTDDTSRSHFETQDSIELGQPQDESRDFRSGFLNRLAATLSGAGAIAFTDQLPISLQGTVNIPNVSLRNAAKPGVDARQGGIIASMYAGTPLSTTVNEGFTVREEVMRELSAEMQAASRDAISARGFELEARRIARLMKDRYRIGFIDVGGWDTHVGQGGASGYLAGRLEELGRGLAAYAGEMGPEWNRTVVVVMSEFGRTFRENGNRGTDHGHGGVFWILGGAVRGGRIAGEQRAVNAAGLFQNRDLPVLNEYRAVLGGLFARLYGLGERDLDRVFRRVRPRDLQLL